MNDDDDEYSYADSLQSFGSRSSQYTQPTDDCSSCGSIATFSSYHSYESSQGGLTADEESACESTASAFSYEDSPPSRRRPSALRRLPAATTADAAAAARRVSFAENDDNTSLHSAHSSSEFIKRDLLTVFRAAPLVYFDKKGSPHPMALPDFEYEKSLLSESLQEAEKDGHKINLSFKTATIKQFGTILARGECRVLHLSCHGSKTYLMLDNGHGTAKPLLVDRLKKWITKGENSLQFVFIAACHSRSAGEAFVAAGVPHVVCCQHDNVKLRDTAAIEFASAFYRNLACGRNLDDAFEQGRLEVMNSDSVVNAENEMKKFVLLPQNGQHDQPIFFTESTTTDQSVRKPRSRRRSRQKHNIPHTHQVFLGRNTEIWKVLDNLKISRLVRISGDRGIGKRSLAAAVAQHILRFLPNLVEDIIWLPYNATSNDRRVDHLLSNIFDACNNNEISALEFREKKRTEARAVYDLLHEKKLLLIVDARKLESTEKLCTFLDCLLEETLHVRVIVVHRGDRVVCNNDFPVVESDMEVTPLDISASVKVFGRVCPHRTSSEELKDLEKFFATPSDVPKDIFRMESSSEVCKLLQSGNPYKIRRAAKKISLDQYQELISEIRAPVTMETRVDLDEEFKRLTHQIGKATTHRDFSAIRSIQEKLDRIDRLREARPDIGTLQMMADDVQTDQDYAFSIKDFDSAEQLNEQLESLLSQIDLEKSALRRRGVRGPHHELWNERYPHYGTRAGLEAEIQKQQSLWERASITGISENAHNTVGRIKYLMSRRPKWLTGDQLDSELSRLQQEKREAIGRLNPKTSEQLSLRSKALRKQLKKERLAEEVLRGELSSSEQTPPEQSRPAVEPERSNNSSGHPSLDQSQPRTAQPRTALEGSSNIVTNEGENVAHEQQEVNREESNQESFSRQSMGGASNLANLDETAFASMNSQDPPELGGSLQADATPRSTGGKRIPKDPPASRDPPGSQDLQPRSDQYKTTESSDSGSSSSGEGGAGRRQNTRAEREARKAAQQNIPRNAAAVATQQRVPEPGETQPKDPQRWEAAQVIRADQGASPSTAPTEGVPGAIAVSGLDREDSVGSMITTPAELMNLPEEDLRIQRLVEESVQRRLQEDENVRQNLLASIPVAAEVVEDEESEEKSIPPKRGLRKFFSRKKKDKKKKDKRR